MKKLALSATTFVAALLLSTSITFACDDGSCDPEPTPEPEPPAVVHDLGGEGSSFSQSVYYPCCIMNGGGVKPLWDLFRTPEQVVKMCQRALEQGNSNIYACEDPPVDLK